MPYKDKEKAKAQRRKWEAAHREELRAKNRKRYWSDPEKWRAYNREKSKRYNRIRPNTYKPDKHLKKKYGLTLEQRKELDTRNGICHNLSCSRPVWGVDHNHTTTKIRGLLCRQCNMVLGLMQDDPLLLTGLSDYLNKF